ncbi:MAG TPA: response regulator [Mariprofundaceae bacterium]|nr:response regulator [Mariprofundaceae bacterium]
MASVLLIDDEELMHNVVNSYLKRYGKQHDLEINVKALHDPVQGFLETSMYGSNYDLILLDLRLPKLSGDEIYNSLKQLRPELLERVLFVTAYGEELQNRLHGEEVHILQKPFLYNNFETAISTMLS